MTNYLMFFTQYGQPIRLMIAYVGEECEEKRYEFCPRKYQLFV